MFEYIQTLPIFSVLLRTIILAIFIVQGIKAEPKKYLKTGMINYEVEVGYFGIKLNKIFSLLLFLYPYKRKVSLWIVIMQILNYFMVFVALFIQLGLNIQSNYVEGILSLMAFSYMAILLVLSMIDLSLFTSRNSHHY